MKKWLFEPDYDGMTGIDFLSMAIPMFCLLVIVFFLIATGG